MCGGHQASGTSLVLSLEQSLSLRLTASCYTCKRSSWSTQRPHGHETVGRAPGEPRGPAPAPSPGYLEVLGPLGTVLHSPALLQWRPQDGCDGLFLPVQVAGHLVQASQQLAAL